MPTVTLKRCKATNCLHDSRDILETDEIMQKQSCFYHKDCFKAQQDIQYIKSLWHDNIDRLVVYKQLIDVLNGFIYREKIDSDYIVFTVEYCINHKLNLHYPYGLKWFLSKKEIKDAYNKSKIKTIPKGAFIAPKESNEPSFSINTNSNGFLNILGGGNNKK